MIRSTVIIFCGIPGSGKSTIARTLARALKKNKKSVGLFVSDNIPGRLYRSLSKILRDNLGKLDYILLDATFFKDKWRRTVYRLAHRHRILLVQIKANLETCLARNKKRKPRVPQKVVHIMYRSFEQIQKPHLTIDTEKLNPKEATEKILSALHLS